MLFTSTLQRYRFSVELLFSYQKLVCVRLCFSDFKTFQTNHSGCVRKEHCCRVCMTLTAPSH